MIEPLFNQVHTPITISIGVAILDAQVTDLESLMSCADHALYQAKQSGRNRWVMSA